MSLAAGKRAALKRYRASAPGKTILMGEHAAVYGRPALVAAVNRRLTVTIEVDEAGPAGVQLFLPALGVDGEFASWEELRSYAAERRELWRELQETWQALQETQSPGPAPFGRLRGDDRAHVVKAALGELLLFLGQTPAERHGLRLEIASELPLGSGFGSSAACATAVLLAAAAAFETTLDSEQLLHLALEVERRQHGSPSGVDNATVLYGGILWVEKDAAGKLHTTPLLPKTGELLPGLRFFQSGEPAEPTGAVVAAVRELRGRDITGFETRLDAMAAATAELRDELESAAPRQERLIALFREFESHLEACGVVPESVRRVIRQVEECGGAAKISGAGSLTGPGAGSLLVLAPEGRILEFPPSFLELDLKLGAAGARIEEA